MEQQIQPQIPKTLNVLLILGAIGYVGIIALFIWLVMVMFKPVKQPALAPTLPGTTATIGELGSRCGGSEGLPCRPGLLCSVKPDTWNTTYGECVTDTRPTHPPGILGSVCGGDLGCGPGLLCKHGAASATGTCATVATSTPPVAQPK